MLPFITPRIQREVAPNSKNEYTWKYHQYKNLLLFFGQSNLQQILHFVQDDRQGAIVPEWLNYIVHERFFCYSVSHQLTDERQRHGQAYLYKT